VITIKNSFPIPIVDEFLDKLCDAPTMFQSLINAIYKDVLRKFVLTFFDDILSYSPTWEAHLNHLELVLHSLKLHQLYTHLDKCSFKMEVVDY